jgi:RHS repeat-associated protein
MSAQSLQKAFVPLPGGGSAVYTSAGLAYYRHPDWLGSSRLATTPSRTCYSDVAYAPFGESYGAGCGTQDLNFTGQNQDTASGLYDFPKREYQTISGRWISPDPGGTGAVSFENPQSWNRYAYSLNDPARLTDSSGNYPQDQHEFFTFMLAVWAGRPDAQELANGARGADNFWNATGLPGLSYFFGLGLILNYGKHFGDGQSRQIGSGYDGGFDMHLIEDNGASDAPHHQGAWHHIVANLAGHSVDTDPTLGGGFRAAGMKLGLPANSPVFDLLEWARININAGCGGSCGKKIVGESIVFTAADSSQKTFSRGESDVTGMQPVMSFSDSQGNVLNIYDVSTVSFWDQPAIQAIEAEAALSSLSGDMNSNIEEAMAIYLHELP